MFALKDPTAIPELPVSSCVMTRCLDADGEECVRPYTPIDQDQPGVLNLLIKRYEQGIMSR